MIFRAMLIGAVMALCTSASAMAAGADQPTECDTLAAHKSDPDRMAAGVDMDSIVPRLAIAACEAALAQYPDDPRFHYLLGRAFLAASRTADSIAQFQRAAEAGYAMANYNLGLAYEEAGDYDEAAKYMKLAVDSGIAPARDALAGLVFTGEGFSSPGFFEAIYNGEINSNRSAVLYVSTFLQIFNNTAGCQAVAGSNVTVRAAQLAQKSMFGQMLGALSSAGGDGTFEGAASAGARAGQDFTASLATQVDRVQDDANLFYTRYDCDTPIAKQFFGNLADWVYAG